jgi:aspartate carbamoyltransferase regulatory subunit
VKFIEHIIWKKKSEVDRLEKLDYIVKFTRIHCVTPQENTISPRALKHNKQNLSIKC